VKVFDLKRTTCSLRTGGPALEVSSEATPSAAGSQAAIAAVASKAKSKSKRAEDLPFEGGWNVFLHGRNIIRSLRTLVSDYSANSLSRAAHCPSVHRFSDVFNRKLRLIARD
jgi:hypothetical protein